MNAPLLVITGATLVGCVVAGVVYASIKSDLTVVLRNLLQHAVEVEAALLLPAASKKRIIDWEREDVEQMRRSGGSGVGVQLLFLLLTIPRAAIRMRLTRRTERT